VTRISQKQQIFLDGIMGYMVKIDKHDYESNWFGGFVSYCVSTVPGQGLMRDQVWNKAGVR
jgi:hypothetical protein